MFPLYMAERLFRASFSLIPLRGAKDSSAPKVPTLDWKIFQHRAATKPQVNDWITHPDKLWQLGIVTGRISGVIVLDFDTMALWQRFSTEMPHIVRDKLTVRTRRGIHLYIPVATAGAPIPKKKGKGWDLQTDGFYVVAPGSEINGHTYTIETGDLDQMPAPTPGQLEEIRAWLDALTAGASAPAAVVQQPTLPGIPADRHELLQAVRTRFQAEMPAGRNDALFKALTWGRDRGLTVDDCRGILADFLKAPGDDPETESQRMKEFEKTLKSAFSRPARPVGAAPARLPDSVRQALARRDLMHIWRLLDGLYGAGVRPGQVITRKIANALCGQMLGVRNVWRALSDAKFFRRVEGKGSLALSPNAYGVEPEKPHDTTEALEKDLEKCNYSRGKILQLNGHCNRGRPPHLYAIPSVEAVCRLLGIKKPRWCTPIQHRSSKEARMALYYSKISHKPGTYANAALAAWFGCSAKTIKNYERELKIVRRPQYEETPVAAWNTESLPEPRMGVWLQQHGDRYPSVPAIAEKLLKRGRVSLVAQRPNHISTAAYQQQQKAAAMARIQAAHKPQQAIPAPLVDQPISTPTKVDQKPLWIARDEANFVFRSPSKEQSKPVERRLADLASVEPDWEHDQELLNLLKTSKPTETHALSFTVTQDAETYPDDAMRTLKRQWSMLQGVGISSNTTKSDRLELVQRVMPDAGKHMSDHQYGYLEDATPRRMLMWLRKRVADPLYTREDVNQLYRLMDGALTRKRAVALFNEYGRTKALRAAEFIAKRWDIENPPAYLITCLKADKRMAALMGGR